MLTRLFHIISALCLILLPSQAYTSATMSHKELSNVNKTQVDTEQVKLRLQKAAGLLAEYEIEANKLLDLLEEGGTSKALSVKAESLLNLSETVIESARFRLPQCDEYLSKTLNLRASLSSISHESLEKNYHQDGALPKAPGECYHTKDLFVHPATVMVLTRDDPDLADETKGSIKAEVSEVLAHTEIVRQLVVY